MHGHANRGDLRLLATGINRHGYAENGLGRPPPDLNGKEGVSGSSPEEGLEKRAGSSGLAPRVGYIAPTSGDVAVEDS